MINDEWVKFEIADYWGHLYLRILGMVEDPDAYENRVSIRSTVHVRWPNGETGRYNTGNIRHVVKDHIQGEMPQIVSSTTPSIIYYVEGARLDICLTKVEVHPSSILVKGETDE